MSGPHSRLDFWSKLRGWWSSYIQGYGLLTLVLCSTALPFLLHINLIGVADYDQFATFNQIALWWHQLGDYTVAWNPFLCGGATLVGNPQIPLFHPNLIIYAIFGPVNGLALSLVVWMVPGYISMRALACYYGLSREIASVVGATWVINGFFVGHLGNMHAMNTAFLVLPGFLLMNCHILRGRKDVLGYFPWVLAFVSLYNHHFIAYGLPFIVMHFVLQWWSEQRPVERIIQVVTQRGAAPRKSRSLTGIQTVSAIGPGLSSRWYIVPIYGVGVALAVGMVACFFLPAMAWNQDFPRYKAPESFHLIDLLQMLWFPLPLIPFDRPHDVHEYFLTVGPVWCIWIIYGARKLVGETSKMGPLLVLAGISGVFSLGSSTGLGWPAVAPFDLLRQWVPGYQAIRVPPRFFIHALLVLHLVGGYGWQRWLDQKPRSLYLRRWMVIGALLPLVIFNFCYYQYSLFSSVRGIWRPQTAYITNDFHWALPGHRFRMMKVISANVGVLDCYEALEVPTAKQLSYMSDIVLSSDLDVTVNRVSWGEIVLMVNNSETSPGQGSSRSHVISTEPIPKVGDESVVVPTGSVPKVDDEPVVVPTEPIPKVGDEPVVVPTGSVPKVDDEPVVVPTESMPKVGDEPVVVPTGSMPKVDDQLVVVPTGSISKVDDEPVVGRDRITMNFNHHSGWTVVDSDGEVVIESSMYEPLTLSVSSGVSRIHLRYLEPAWWLGIQMTIGCLVLGLGWFFFFGMSRIDDY